MKKIVRLWAVYLVIVTALMAYLGLVGQAQADTLLGINVGCRSDAAGQQRCLASLRQDAPAQKALPVAPHAPDVATPVIVLPTKKKLMAGWVEYNRNTCALISSGSWAVITPPSKGETSTALFTSTLANGECPGVSFPFSVVYYTWTSVDPKDRADAFNAVWTSPDFSNPGDFAITVAHVDVSAVDLSTGKVSAVLVAPGTLKGPVAMTLDGVGVSSSPTPASTEYASGTASIPIDRPKIARGLYNKLSLSWTVDGIQLKGSLDQAAWDVQGVIRYSQYNLPLESSCTGGDGAVWMVDSVSNCQFTAATLKSSFIAQTQLNGTGSSVSYGYVKGARATGVRKYCKGKFPTGATLDNTFVQVSSVTGSCNRALVAGSSAATADGSCTAVDLLVDRANNTNFGNRNSDDTCPACGGDFRGTDGHIDSYSANQSCSAHDAADLGNFWTLKTR